MTQNPYHRLVELARQATVPDELIEITPDTDLNKLARVVAANRPILEEARKCYTPECGVPLQFAKNYFDEHMSEIQDLRNFARAYSMAGSLQQIEQKWSEAVQTGIDLLWLAVVTRRGGLLVDMLVAHAIDGVGMNVLRKSRVHLEQRERSQLLAVLPQVEAAIEPLEIIQARDRDWEIAVEYEEEPLDPDEFFDELEQSMVESEPQLPAEQRRELQETIQAWYKEMQTVGTKTYHAQFDLCRCAKLRMLMIDLALRTYHRALDDYPVELSQLAPAVLTDVPLDPFTGKPFLYHWMPHDFQLSSPGPSGADSGVLGPWPMVSEGKANLCLDEADFYEE